MRHDPKKSYWSKTYPIGTASIYAWERLDRGGYVFVLFRDSTKNGGTRREKQKLPGDLRVRDGKGRVHNASVREVDAAVATFAAQLVLGQRPANQHEPTPDALTLTAGFEKALDIGSGKYPAKTLRWQEVDRARTKLERIIGKSTPWASIKPGDVRRVWRTLANEYKNASPGERACGPRQAEVTVIPSDAVLAPTKWRAKLKREWEQLVGCVVAPCRPRHSLEELGRLLAAMHDALTADLLSPSISVENNDSARCYGVAARTSIFPSLTSRIGRMRLLAISASFACLALATRKRLRSC